MMEWVQVLTIIGSTLGMVLWVRSESNADRREAAADRRDILQLIRKIDDEMKDFHGKLERQDAEFKAHLMYHHDTARK